LPKQDSIPVTIYQLDERLGDDDTFDDLTHRIIRAINEKRKNKFEDEIISPPSREGFNIKLYHTHKIDPPNWKAFLAPILKSDSLLQNCLNTIYSFICFIEYNNYVYAITGGTGSFAIDRFINTTFGLDLLAKMINEDEKVIKEIKERDVTGAILGQTKFYRGDQSILSNAEFGKIVRLVTAELNKQILVNVLGFSPNELKRKTSRCLAKEAFKISKSIKFDILLNLIEKFSTLLSLESKFELNKVTLISRRKPQNRTLLRQLREELTKQLYDKVKDGEPIDFDFCNVKYEDYHSAEYFSFYFGTEKYFESEDPLSFEELIEKLKKEEKFHDQTIELFNTSVLSVEIQSFSEQGEIITEDTVFDHLHGEIKFDGSTYFFVDKEWYTIQIEFINDLNRACQEVVKQCWDDKLISERFVNKNEDEQVFNLRFCNRPNCWVLDKITPENIEVCDILIDEDNTLNLIHVKKGFNNNMRDLAAQVLISAKRIRYTIHTDYNYIDLLEKRVNAGLTSQSTFYRTLASQTFPKDGLRTLFDRRDDQIAFCLAFVDIVDNVRCFQTSVEDFDSNIAKYSLVNLKKEIQSMGFKFKLIQIKKVGD
jgi:uncharacterized protein (TIGR04141 family)